LGKTEWTFELISRIFRYTEWANRLIEFR